MTKPMPKWLMHRYSLLWRTFGSKKFYFGDALKGLKEKKERLVSVILSEIKKHGWLTLGLDPEDSRKRIYKLKSPEEAVKEMGELES